VCRPTAELSFRGGNATSSPFLPADRRLFGRPLPSVWLDGATVAFEPGAYSAYNGDMGNVADDDMAAHFAAYGRAERRVGRRLRLILRCVDATPLKYIFKRRFSSEIYSNLIQPLSVR